MVGQGLGCRDHLLASVPLTGCLYSLQGRFGPSLVQGLLAVSLTANALFTSAYLYQSLR